MKKQADEKAAFEERLKAVIKESLREGGERGDSFFNGDIFFEEGPIDLFCLRVWHSNQPVGIFEVKGRMMAVRLPITLPFCV